MQLDWSKTTKHFSVHSCRKFLSWHKTRRWAGEQASGILPWDRYFSFFWVVISTMYIIFHLGKMLIRFLSIICYLYCSLALQLSCISLRLSDGMFLSFANDYFQWRINFCSVLWRPVSLYFSLLSVLGAYGCWELLFYGKLGWEWGGCY